MLASLFWASKELASHAKDRLHGQRLLPVSFRRRVAQCMRTALSKDGTGPAVPLVQEPLAQDLAMLAKMAEAGAQVVNNSLDGCRCGHVAGSYLSVNRTDRVQPGSPGMNADQHTHFIF